MSQALYEQYKEALRRGHVAARHGRLDVAESAYRTAAAIAPDRALPFVSLAGVLRRRDRLDEALAAYDAALARVPGDEGALRGRAELHTDARRRTAAAGDFDALSLALERAGRLTDALDAATRALDLAESRSRRRDVDRLRGLIEDAERLGERAEAAEPAEQAEPAEPGQSGHSGERAESGSEASADETTPGGPAVDGVVDAPREPLTQPVTDSVRLPPPDPAVLRAVADALLDSGDLTGATERYLALAAHYRSEGRHDAAMDACLALLAASPSSVRLQLEIAAIQADRGWLQTAAEKINLLLRLVDLDEDSGARVAVEAFAVQRGIWREGAVAPAE